MRLFALVALLLAGCKVDTYKPAPKGLRVLTTTGMIADAVTRIVGPRGTVDALMGPGVDPHLYRAKAGDLTRLQQADLIVYNGLHLEGKMADVLEGLPKSVAITRGLDPKTDLRPAPEGFEGAHDPHVWFDVRLWAKSLDTVRDALTKIDPAGEKDYAERTRAYQAELHALDAEVKRRAATIPAGRRVLITAHDAFYYFGRAYGFEVRGLQGVSTESAPGTHDVRDLATLIGTRKVPAIFGESSVPDRNLQAVVDAVQRDHGFTVKFIAGSLYSDALGDRGGPAGTYVGMVTHNIDAIVAALR
ncbi:MAG: zinc ABC transporter substrate-binding protein [Gemmataceae bacterium]|nr:zinc ABC transporter substrate-binding protein [Gemmataceae bacterium]